MCCCRYKFTWYCKEQMTQLHYRPISPLSNQFIAQLELSLTCTANQELTRMSNFRAHTECTRQEDVQAIFCVSYCIVHLISFRCVSPRCSVSKLPVLCHAIRHRFSAAPAPSFAWFLFLNIITKTTNGATQWSCCKTSNMCAYAVYSEPLHQITKYNGNCKRQMSHQSNTDYFARIFFLPNGTDQDLHRPS